MRPPFRDRALLALKKISDALKEHGIPDAEKEAEIMLTEGLGIDRVSLYRDNPALSEADLKKIESFLQRRVGREPLQYIIGSVSFFGLKIQVGPGVLIPRPETELLVEEALKVIHPATFNPPASPLGKGGLKGGSYKPLLLDLCTGSGCIALALAKNLPDSEVYATDVEDEALRYAKKNAEANGIENVKFLKGYLFESLGGLKFDLIASNPPYIKSSIIEGLQPEVRDYEPRTALDGGGDGLKFIREIFEKAPGHLRPGGRLIIEMAEGQAGAVKDIARSAGFESLKIIRDYAGIERIIAACVMAV